MTPIQSSLPGLSTLAQSAGSGASISNVAASPVFIVSCAALAVAAIIGYFVIVAIRKRTIGGDARRGGTTFADLRAMRDRGEITPDEYAKIRANMVDAVKHGPVRRTPTISAFIDTDTRTLIAKPGRDLTGEPLPGHTEHQDGG